MTPNEIGQILKELGGIKAILHETRTDILEFKDEVKLTNGRVTSIEDRHKAEDAVARERARIAAVHDTKTSRWFAPIVTGSTVAFVAAVITVAVKFI